jgi:hypothetical protein
VKRRRTLDLAGDTMTALGEIESAVAPDAPTLVGVIEAELSN